MLILESSRERSWLATQPLGQSIKGAIPFMIQGTTSSPVFVPDVAGAVSSGLVSSLQQRHQQSGQRGLGGILGGILGKKK